MKYCLWFFERFLQPAFFILVNIIGIRLSEKIKARINFEKKNLKDELSESFKFSGKTAQVVFEVSSEGELEQVLPIIKGVLKKGHLVEVVFCSASVEKKCSELAHEYRDRLRIFRLPLLSSLPNRSGSFTRWVTAKSFVLCRYDFFPELLSYGMNSSVTFHLISATVKNKNFSNIFSYFFWHFVYENFDSIVAATPEDKERLVSELDISAQGIDVFDFRTIQIGERLGRKEETLNLRKFFPSFKTYLDLFPREKRIVCGSFWLKEAALLSHPDLMKKISQNEIQLTILPHTFAQSYLEELIKSLRWAMEDKLPLYIVSADNGKDPALIFQEAAKNPGIIVLLERGILCELYSYFGHAYVGGGFGRSVHSVLEPFMGRAQVYLGPKIHRSTEFDFILSLANQEIHVLTEFSSVIFYNTLIENQNRVIEKSVMDKIVGEGTPYFENYLKKILDQEKNHAAEKGL